MAKRVKKIGEMLNERQKQAIVRARSGDYLLLIQCCLECAKAEQKALKAVEMGVPEWGKKTAEHYYNLRLFLEQYFDDIDTWNVYAVSMERITTNGI